MTAIPDRWRFGFPLDPSPAETELARQADELTLGVLKVAGESGDVEAHVRGWVEAKRAAGGHCLPPSGARPASR